MAKKSILQFLMALGEPVAFEAPFDFVRPDADCCNMSLSRQAILESLRAEFSENTLLERGILVNCPSGVQLNRRLAVGHGAWLLLRSQSGNPFDIVTPNGCLSGRAPVLAARQDAKTRRLLHDTKHLLFAAQTTDDAALLRTLGVASTIVKALDRLRTREMQQLGQMTGSLNMGDLERRAVDKINDVGGVALVLVAASITGIRAEVSQHLTAVARHLFNAEQFLGVNWGSAFVWWPTETELQNLRFRALLRDPAVLRGLLTQDSLALYSLDTFADVGEPRRPANPDEDLIVALDQLKKARQDFIEMESKHYADKLLAATQTFVNAIEHQIAEPILEYGMSDSDPLVRSLAIPLCQITTAAHATIPGMMFGLPERLQATLTGGGELLPEAEFERFTKLINQQVDMLQTIAKLQRRRS